MAYKRRRGRRRKLPRPGSGRRPDLERHSGPLMGIPSVTGGGDADLSISEDGEEKTPRSFWARFVLLPLAIAATAIFILFLLTDLWLLLWAGLGVGLLFLIYKTWRP